MDGFFDEIGSALLLFLFLTILNKGEKDTTEEEKLEDRLETSIPEPAIYQEVISYTRKSRNRKRLKPKSVYF